MPLTFPRDLVYEMYLGRWVEVTALPEERGLRQSDPVTVSWGLPSEQGKALAPPGTVEGVLNNTGGHWTPGNPMSDYFDYLQGRNVPTRLALRVSRDDCNDVVVNGWGTLDTGEVWQVGTGAGGSVVLSDWQKDGDSANHSVPVAAGYRQSWVDDAYRNLEVAAACRVDIDPVNGGDIEPANLILRRTSGDSYYLVRCVVASTQMVRLSIYYHDGVGSDSLISGPVDVPAAVQSAGHKSLWVKAYVEEETLRAKVWQIGTDEPLGWHVSARDGRLPAAGGFGVRSGVGGGNTNTKPVLFQYTVVEARLPRHSGELQKLEPDWDESHRVKKAKFRSAGVSARLGLPERQALATAPRYYLSQNNPIRWWPLDDADTATYGAPLVGSEAVTLTDTDMPANRLWGRGSLGLHAPRALFVDWAESAVDGFGQPEYVLRANFSATISGSWCFDFIINIPAGRTPNVRLQVNPGAAPTYVGQVQLDLSSTAGTSWVTFPAAGPVASFTADIYDGLPHHLRVEASQSGPNATAVAYVDGVLMAGTTKAVTLANLTGYVIHTTSGALPVRPAEGYSIGHVAVWTGGTQPSVVPTALAAVGYAGERALTRAIRLCSQNGVTLDYAGDPAHSAAMGPQRPLPLLDLVAECAETDGGPLYEPRSTNGLAIRSRRSMCAQAASATLSYAAGQVARELRPSADDRPTANDVRASDLAGNTHRLVQAAGPMNVGEPGTSPDAAGRTPRDLKPNVASPAQLPDAAGWALALGTVPEVRFPRVTVNLRATEVSAAALQAAVLNLGVGSRLLVTGMQAADVYRDLDQLVRGGKETYRNVRSHQVTLNTAPYEKYRAGVFGDSASRWDGAVTTLNSSLNSTTTGGRNVTTSAGQLWTTAASAYPLDVLIGGERVTVSGFGAPSGAVQLMTISARSVNGVVKSHNAGTRVYLADPVYYS